MLKKKRKTLQKHDKRVNVKKPSKIAQKPEKNPSKMF